MGLIRYFVGKRIFVNLVVLFVMVAGIYTFATSAKEVFPQIKLGYIVVSVVYPQASSGEIEKLLTIPIENAIEDVRDIKEITSWSSEGLAMIGVELEPDVADVKSIMDDIESEVNKIQDLPEDAQDPEILEISTDFFPLINLSVSGGKDYTQLREVATRLEERLEDVKGVGEIVKTGYYDRAIWIDVDKHKLSEYGLTLYNFINVLRDRDISMPAGNKVFGNKEYAVRLTLPLETAEDAGNVIIRSNDWGKNVRVHDVATVTDGFQDEEMYVRAQGERAILMEIKKQKKHDTIKMVKNLRKTVEKIKAELPAGVEISFSNDMSIYLKNRLDVLYSNGFFGALLVLIMLMLLLRPSVAVWTAVGMPVAFAIAIVVALRLGIDMNMMSIMGYIMVLGMVVDDAIVVGENVHRHMEMGEPPFEAAVKGAQEMFLPVMASVATTIAAFSPLMLVGGMMGEFLSSIPKVIIIALAASLFECFFILPSHLADFVKPKKHMVMEAKRGHWFDALRELYGKMLNWVLHRRILFAVMIILLMIGVTMLEVRNGFVFTDAQMQEISVDLKLNKNYSVDDTEKVIIRMEKQILGMLSKKDLDVVNSYIGMANDRHGPPRFAPNLAQITILLHIEDKRETKDANQIVNALRERIGKPKGVRDIQIEAVKGGPPTGSAIDVKVIGGSYEQLLEVSNDLIVQAKKIEMPVKGKLKPGEPGTFYPVTDIKTDFEEGKSEIRLVVDEAKASLAGVSLSQAGTLLRAAIAGIELKTLKKLGEDVAVMVRVNEQSISTLDELLDLRVPNNRGNRILMREIVTVERGTAYSTLVHKNGRRTISVIGSVDQIKTNVNAVNQKISELLETLKKKYTTTAFEIGGEQKEMMEGFMDLARAFLIAIFLIFIILATLFNSVIQPLIIMLAIPFGFIGVMLTLLLHGMPISFMAFMGFIGLSGVVVNDSLILVSFVNNLIKDGKPVEEAVIEGAKTRLRPVILTTVTTAVGLFPLAYGWFGGEEPFIRPMAIVFSWGLVFATIVTLFIIPCFWVIVKNMRVVMMRIVKKDKTIPIFFSKKEWLLKKHEAARSAISEKEKLGTATKKKVVSRKRKKT
ncbi:efflux RND transporter permease subunit [bacterium]|nr:efflux RND transporter permease subunit [bacterium]